MVDFLFAFDLGWIVWEVLVDSKVEMKGSTFVHALIRVDCQGEVEDIVGVGERCFHCSPQRAFKLLEVYTVVSVGLGHHDHHTAEMYLSVLLVERL